MRSDPAEWTGRPAPWPRGGSVCALLALAVASGMGSGLPAPIAAQAVGSESRGASPDRATLTGTVRSRFGDGIRSLPSAVVEVVGAGVSETLTADEVGRYRLTGLPAGPVRIRASHPGHDAVRLVVMLAAGSTLHVDLELLATPLELGSVDVRAAEERTGTIPDADPADPRDGEFLVLREIMESGTGASETSVSDAVRALPGRDPADPTDVLFMRGSSTELKLVLLDGVPVVTPYQVAGLVRGLDASVLSSARFHRGGAPARYDGGLTHILDLRTRTARRDRLRVSGSVDLLASALTAEVPLGRHAGVIASGRHLNGLGQPAVDGSRPYGYTDGLVSLDVQPAEGHRIRATGFWNAESVRLDYRDHPAPAEWGNAAASAAWSAEVRGAALSASVGASRYQARLPLRPAPTESDSVPSDILASASTRRVRAVVEAAWGDPERSFRAGVSVESLGTEVAADVVDEATGSRLQGHRAVAGAFAETRRTIADGVSVRAGLRGDLFQGNAAQLSPRFSLSWVAGPSALVTLAAGRYHQMTQSLSTGFVHQGGAPPQATAELLPLARADHVVLTLQQRFGDGLGIDLDGYWKRFEGTGGRQDPPILNSGVDVRVRGGAERARLWLGYGLSWFWTPDGTQPIAGTFAGRHLLTAGLSGAVAGPVHAEATFAYGAGLPSTGVPLGSSESAALAGPGLETLSAMPADHLRDVPPPDFSFLRIDLEVYASFEPEWMGHRWQLRPYVRLLNPLDRRDALFYAYGAADGALVPLARRPVLPVAGIAFSY